MATTYRSPAQRSDTTISSENAPYEVGHRYVVTEVLGWWLRQPTKPPAWIPVMGPVHQDLEYFEVEDHHYHVDPRFINEEFEEHAQRATAYRRMFTGDTWHRSYRIVLTAFPVPEAEESYFLVRNLHTAVYNRDRARRAFRQSKAWGLERIRHRRRRLECLRPMPPIEISGDSMNVGFHELHAEYPDACGDICPHRGYDLRNIAVDPDGYRRCPIHQLRVRAPGTPQPGTHQP